ncbi:hypothetical protein IJJ46_00415 [Candidatus Saccharibacteria bacterium]|nr:hypothetical protein [Candidatus Saccharibacteria bacterium]
MSRLNRLKPRQILPTAARRRKLDRRYLFLVAFAFMLASTFTFLRFSHQQETDAASLANFDSGNIITNYNMSRYNSMTEAEIQNFLKSKNKCNDTRTYLAQQYSSYTYHIENGHFVCMADEKFDTTTGEPATKDSKSTETAAHIIYTVSQEYKINPQVLIVLLQKEQGLVTDTWPNYRQYRAATGYGCPDTAACDTKYYGLRNQISNAARLFRTVLDGGWTNYPLGNNYVQYNPNSGCGGTTVNIKNLATSSLYRYTPYQPNQAALNAGYGTGDGCSAYGNRNFYLYFSDWFYDPTDDSTASPLGVSQSLTAEQVKIANKIVEQFKKLGGESKFGKEKTGLEWNSATGIYWVEYEKGFIVGNDKYGYYESTGKIREVWKKKGFESSNLGFPTSNIETNAKTGIYWQYFTGGAIVGNDKYGYYESSGKVREVWKNQGFESGPLGFPTSNYEQNNNTGIRWQYYSGGAIVGNDKKGYFESRGKIREVWRNLNFEMGYLGFPTSNIETNTKTGIYWQYFEGGAIVGSDKYGYYESSGKIRETWAAQSFEMGKLGFPLGNIYNSGTNQKAQKYQGGIIYLDTKTNKTTVKYN